MSAWGDGGTITRQPCVVTYDFGGGRVIRIDHEHMVKRTYTGLFVESRPTGLIRVEMEGFSEDERGEFMALRDAKDETGMQAFIDSRMNKSPPST